MTSVLDVVDGFFGPGDVDILRVPGTVLFEFGEEVRRFADAHDPTSQIKSGARYFGGWPSAAFPSLDSSGVVLSSLLYVEQAIVKDSITDWFSDDQYQVEHKLSSSPGWMTQTGEPTTQYTRHFLANAIREMRRIQPLVDSGIVLLVPEESIFLRLNKEITTLRAALSDTLLGDIRPLIERFKPADLAVDNTRRGMFAFAPQSSGQEFQIVKAFEDSLLYFARQYALSTTLGAAYTAPFPFEDFVCRHGVGPAITPSDAVVHCVLNSPMPIYKGLRPELLVSLHEDDRFAAFRMDLSNLYGGAPRDGDASALKAYIEDQEATNLAPKLNAASKDLDRGVLGRLGVSAQGTAFGLAAGLAAGVIEQSLIPGALGAAGAVVDAVRQNRRDSGTLPLWTSLVRHARKPDHEVVDANTRSGSQGEGWAIPEAPAMSVVISSGIVRADWLPAHANPVSGAGAGYDKGSYRQCECGSGRKYKFCCSGADAVTRSWRRPY